MTMATCAAVVLVKPSTQGETSTQSPTTRLNHSSHTANAANAPIERIAITMPLIMAF